MLIRTLSRCFVVAISIFASQAGASAPDDYPNRPIKMVLPYAPGGGTDNFARLIAPRMGEYLGQSVVVENRPGGKGAIAALAVAKSAPADGYSILFGDRGMYVLNSIQDEKLPYDPEVDLVPVTMLAVYDFVLVVNPKVLPVKTVGDIIEAAKKAPKGINFAAPGMSTHTLAMDLFRHSAGVNLVPVAYKGGAPALQDVLAGHVGMMFLDRVSAAPHIESGSLRAIAAAGSTRIDAYPDVPTMAESGLPGFNANAWVAFTMRSGTPPGIVERIQKAYAHAVSDPEFRKKLTESGITPMPGTGEDLARHMRAEKALWSGILGNGSGK